MLSSVETPTVSPRQVLRRHKEALLTVVEVVLHDPLYKWQMNPVKAQRRQQDLGAEDAGEGARPARVVVVFLELLVVSACVSACRC
jgi:hypothetical protein